VPGTNLGDYLPDHMLPEFADVVPFRYEHGKSFVKPEEVPNLGTMMRQLNDWYIDKCKDGTFSFLIGIRDEHDFVGVDSMPIKFEELWQLYNKDTLDKQMMTCYSL
jgi:hypothetical protein